VTSVFDLLRDGITATADKAREAASQLRADKADSYLDSITRTVQAQESLTKAQNAYDEAVRASGARMTEIDAKLQADLSEAEADRQRDLAQAADEAGEQRVKITEEAEKERARIQKRFDRSFAQAVGDRDALAAKRAEEQRKDELEQLDDRYTDQNKAVDDSLKKQQKIIDDRYKAQVATVNAAAQAAVSSATPSPTAPKSIGLTDSPSFTSTERPWYSTKLAPLPAELLAKSCRSTASPTLRKLAISPAPAPVVV